MKRKIALKCYDGDDDDGRLERAFACAQCSSLKQSVHRCALARSARVWPFRRANATVRAMADKLAPLCVVAVQVDVLKRV